MIIKVSSLGCALHQLSYICFAGFEKATN